MATSGISQESINRFGLSHVYTPTGGGLVDIVFVHGLGGHPYHTWTSEKSKIFWPGQLLPLAIEEGKTRVLMYGYDADVTSFTDGVSKDKIHNHAEQLVAELSANRRANSATERPVIFVAHSLGGLVVKRALIHSSEIRSNKTEHLRSIFVSTYGILFLGTPHRGSDIAEWGSRLEWICGAILPTRLIDTQPQLVNALKANSETLQNIDRQFIQLTSRFHIYFFHEGKPTKLKGALRYIVDEESASPNIQDVERACIQQDHSHMCKFENDNAPGFHIVAEAIQRYASQALVTIVSRWKRDKAEQSQRKEAEAEELLPQKFVVRSSENNRPHNSVSLGLSKVSNNLFTVPFNRDKSFINRVGILADINKYIELHYRVALSGIGGVGKSQIAIEYCYRYRDDHPHAHIFWVHASTRERFDEAYKDIARRLELTGWNDPNVDTLRLVCDWFNEVDDESWLMVLDNADDFDLFFTRPDADAIVEQYIPPLVDYLPRDSKGLMLITTRDERVAKRLAGLHASVAVNPMSLPEAQELLESWQTNLAGSSDDGQSTRLLEALGYIPLAITQAAAFINVNKITLKKYLEMFCASDTDLQDLLDKDLGDHRRDLQSQSSVIKTWKMSFDLISNQKPRAAEMLSLMAVLDRQGIPESLLRNASDRNTDFTTALGTLQAFSLIKAGSDGAGYEMHRLVQLATQKWLEIQGAIEKWREKALVVVADMFPDGEINTWTTCESLLPHAQKVLEHQVTSEVYQSKISDLLDNVASFDFEQGRYATACVRYLAGIEVKKKVFGSEHPSTLISMHNLALSYEGHGQLEKAERLLVQILETRKKVLGAEHPQTLSSISNLALTYQEQGQLEEAEKLLLEVLEASRGVLGAEHPDTLTSINNLAATYQEQGRSEEAEMLQLEVLEARKRVQGAEHPETLISINNLALTYEEQGRLEDAEKLQLEVLEARKRVMGAEHPDTLTSMNNLAATYRVQGRFEDAEGLRMQELKAEKRVLGAEHPSTLTSMGNLAILYSDQGRYNEAISLMKSVVELRTKILGANHPKTVGSSRWLKRLLKT